LRKRDGLTGREQETTSQFKSALSVTMIVGISGSIRISVSGDVYTVKPRAISTFSSYNWATSRELSSSRRQRTKGERKYRYRK
jgi:hypothetical protein